MAGNSTDSMMAIAVICPPIQSIVVVTSPNGDHAPPALAAITIMPANQNLSCLLFNNLEQSDVITMAVVRLSNKAERKKVIKVTVKSSLDLLVVVIFSLIIS